MMAKNVDRKDDAPAELESQFILRLPEEPAKALREALQAGVSLKDRLSIKLENDVRYGEVRMDHWVMHAKVVDLPTIVESLKTIDNKSFYKTADICQMMICKEEEDEPTDEESPSKAKKKDPYKVEKKYLWPHGITPPMKNVRRRRFRKTLKKKFVEAPEIEKEVKRLLRGDGDAVNVKWEVITEEDEKAKALGATVKEEPLLQGTAHNTNSMSQSNIDTVAEHDIFGEEVSDSEEEDTNMNMLDMEDTSRLSADDSRSRLSDTASFQGQSETLNQPGLVTQFFKEMFPPKNEMFDADSNPGFKAESSRGYASSEFNPSYKSEPTNYDYDVFKGDLSQSADEDSPSNQLSTETVRNRLNVLEQELADLKTKRQQQELEIAHIENQALQQRFQEILDNLVTEQLDKEQEYQELSNFLQQSED
nr:PREDICTED: transcription initiation factor TFIID subunit 7 [Bemisia tabaci]